MPSDEGSAMRDREHGREKRRFSRFPVEVKAAVKSMTCQVLARTRNISLNGVYLCTGAELPLHGWVQIDFPTADEPSSTIRLRGKIIRREKKGVAVQFGPANIDTFARLQHELAHLLGAESRVRAQVA
jgi:hypothetical protein